MSDRKFLLKQILLAANSVGTVFPAFILVQLSLQNVFFRNH